MDSLTHLERQKAMHVLLLKDKKNVFLACHAKVAITVLVVVTVVAMVL